MSNISPWDVITVPNVDFNVLRIPGERSVPCFWGRDENGSCLFIVELNGDHSTLFRRNAVVVMGLSVDLRSGGSGHQRLVLALDLHADRDLFESFCSTLITALLIAGDSATALSIVFSHLKRWKLFMSGRSGPRLSDDAIRGLFTELVFLRELIASIGSEDAVEAWLGPEQSHQDFIFGNTAVEIKSLSGRERREVRISSEDQLEALSDKLYLRVYRLSSLADVADALSLNEIVAIILSEISAAEVIVEFHRKLVAYGYVPLIEYDKPRFAVSEIRTFSIGNDFPRLVRSTLPKGVTKVGYAIQLETIDIFMVDNKTVFWGV
jgi:Putative  PD-(D/E)XK family member, (DUF4420)